MFKKAITAALLKAKAKTRGGSQIGAAAGGNFAACLMRELAKLPGSAVLKIVEGYKK